MKKVKKVKRDLKVLVKGIESELKLEFPEKRVKLIIYEQIETLSHHIMITMKWDNGANRLQYPVIRVCSDGITDDERLIESYKYAYKSVINSLLFTTISLYTVLYTNKNVVI